MHNAHPPLFVLLNRSTLCTYSILLFQFPCSRRQNARAVAVAAIPTAVIRIVNTVQSVYHRSHALFRIQKRSCVAVCPAHQKYRRCQRHRLPALCPVSIAINVICD